MTVLATTALEWTWGEDQPLVFLGEWCRRYERRERWQARRHVVARYHWDDRRKLRRDYAYLRELHDALLPELVAALNTLHGLERPQRFWQILLDPWLARYVAVVFDRWETLRTVFEEHEITHSAVAEGALAPVLDHREFVEAVSSDPWNYRVYCDILLQEYSGRCVLQPGTGAALAVHPRQLQAVPRPGWKWRLAGKLDELVGRVAPANRFVFVHSYFPPTAFLKLNLALRQMPRLYLREFDWSEARLAMLAPADAPARATLLPKRRATNRFESLLHRRLCQDLPQVFVELFGEMRARSERIALSPKVILTAGAQDQDDLFKHWAAQRVHAGAVFVIMEHGGSIPPLFTSTYHEEEVADVRVTWTAPVHPRHVRLPPNKLAGRRRSHRTADRLVVVGQEMLRYAYDARAMPIAGQVLTAVEQVCQLHDALEELPQRAFLVKPHVSQDWSTRQRFIDRLGRDKVATESRLDVVMRRARIVVCSYPQTTFAEALAFGAVTLLVYPRALYETLPQFDGLVAELQEARILFFDAAEAARHVSAIWLNPLEWWHGGPVREALRRFETEAVDLSRDWLRPWRQFVRGIDGPRGPA